MHTRLHYFDTGEVPRSDFQHAMCVQQGYIPSTCLLAGPVIWGLVNEGKDPCKGCEGDRSVCHGREK